MDNLTHSFTGIALARTGLGRWSPHGIWLLLLSANAPDADLVFALRGPFRYFETHRGYSHSLIAVPFLAVFVMLLVATISRRKLPWLRAWLICVIGISSHLLLDLTNSYGVRLLLPFCSRWLHLDLNGLYDVSILIVLAFAVLWPFFAGLVTGEIGAKRSPGRGLAIFALIFFVAFDGVRAVLHARIIAQLQSRLYGDSPPLAVAALPDSFSPLRWTAVVETSNTYERFNARPFGAFNLGLPQVFYKPPETPALVEASRTDPFRYFLYFARFPVWSVQPVATERTRGTRLDLTDLRFGAPGAGSFHCIAYVDSGGRILGKWLTYGPGTRLGWGPGL